LFITYYGTCSVYAVIVAANFKQIIDHYLGYGVDERLVISLLLVPMILLSWIPNLKYLAPVSMVANVFMGTGLGITFYYLVKDMKPIDREQIPFMANVSEFPNFFSITIFAMEAIGTRITYYNKRNMPFKKRFCLTTFSIIYY
jgi:proton-coupled amino acid transporter